MRYYGLDFARAGFMLTGVIQHAALIYAVKESWIIKSNDGGIVFDYLAGFFHDFRMYGFYIISGFFFYMVFEKYGAVDALVKRVLKLLIPLISVGFTFNYGMTLLSNTRTYSNDVVAFVVNGEWLGHLWFIGNLIVYYFMALPVVFYLSKCKPVVANMWLLSVAAIFGCVIFSVFFRIFGSFTYLENWFFIAFAQLYTYFPSFVLGVVLFWHKELFAFLLRPLVSALYLAIAVCTLFATLYMGNGVQEGLIYKSMKIFYGLTLSIFIIAILNKYGRPSKIISKLVDCSYTIYLLHMPLIVYLFAVPFVGGLGIYSGYLLICAVTYLIAVCAHFYVLKKHPILLFVFNGTQAKPKVKKVA
jgi:peptidoglycan/LPS O-acetylase OafA/YrhL